jgi:hypothetical protein
LEHDAEDDADHERLEKIARKIARMSVSDILTVDVRE